MKNKLYYIVGLAGSGKTSVCMQLAKNTEKSEFIQSSSGFMAYLETQGVVGFSALNTLPSNTRENLVNGFHHSLMADKASNAITILDGHMLVENPITNQRVNAMASYNKGITDGIIFLNTPSAVIKSNIDKDNVTKKRERQGKDASAIKALAEEEFTAAEDYCVENNIDFGVINNPFNGYATEKIFSDVIYLNQYYLSYDADIRTAYKAQFETNLQPQELRHCHFDLGAMLVVPFGDKSGLKQDDYQVLSVPRSGNYLANGFCKDFNGPLLLGKDYESIKDDIDLGLALVIVDSVIDGGGTISRILEALPKSYTKPIHVVCLAINIKAMRVIESYADRVTFHCVGFSNKEDRPAGSSDMGARLYGTKT